MNDNPLNLSQAVRDKLDNLSNNMMQVQINLAQSLEPTLKRHIAVLKHKANPKIPIPADTPVSGRDLKYDTDLLFQAEKIQQLADSISGREISAVSSSPATLAGNIRELLDFSKNTPGFSLSLMPAYKAIIAEDAQVRAELEAKYAEFHPPEKPGILGGLLKRDPKKRGGGERGGASGRGGGQ